MMHRHVFKCITISSITMGVLAFTLSSISKEYLNLFLKSSVISGSIITVSAIGYTYFLKKSKNPKDSHDAVLDSDCSFVTHQKFCPDSYYIIKLGEDDLIFLLTPGASYAKCISQKEYDYITIWVKDDQITVSCPDFWYGTIRIIKL